MPRGSGYTQPPGWRTTVTRILHRDEHRCYLCGGDAITADHIVNVARGGGHGDDNLAAICGTCHDRKTKSEAAEGRRLVHRREREEHPNRAARRRR